MTVAYEQSYRGWATSSHAPLCLEDKYEILRDIGDGSFGSVALGRTRSAGAHVVRRGTLVAIKTMKKTFDSFAECLDLREVILLKSLPGHAHLVPAYDIFLDPLSKRLHIAMEHMDGNLYQLMKARDHKPLDPSSVKSILLQILSGLQHMHDHAFFHRDIKPENILVSTSSPDTGNAFKRYSALVTPPSTPPSYTVKLADFGLARETHSRVPYTTYVSTRWYRAPEVLLRASDYSAPVDIWAVGAMAVEIAMLKPLFPGGNEVDQVWRVCEIMGSPGSWVNRYGQPVGGGEWRDGIRLAHKLGFSFPKMAPHSLTTVLPGQEDLADFVGRCMLWDPKLRPTSRQALEHVYFADAVDPIRPKSSATARILGRKSSTLLQGADDGGHVLSTKTSSWFRKSISGRDAIAPPVHVHIQPVHPPQRPQAVHASTMQGPVDVPRARPANIKRATWANGVATNAAPIPILPSMRPASPLHDDSTAQANPRQAGRADDQHTKIGRQLSVNSQSNPYADTQRALDGSGLKSPLGSQRESFFAHLRKRARRLSGRNQLPMSPNLDDPEAIVGCAPWPANHRPSIPDQHAIAAVAPDPASDPSFFELDRALQVVRYNLDTAAVEPQPLHKVPKRMASIPALKRPHSLPHVGEALEASPAGPGSVLTVSRTRRPARLANANTHYETPDEEDELLNEALTSAHRASTRLDRTYAHPSPTRPTLPHMTVSDSVSYASSQAMARYPTPSPSKDQNGVKFGLHEAGSMEQQQPSVRDPANQPSQPVDIPIPPRQQRKDEVANPQWPTPPYDENDWAAAAAASILATQDMFR